MVMCVEAWVRYSMLCSLEEDERERKGQSEEKEKTKGELSMVV